MSVAQLTLDLVQGTAGSRILQFGPKGDSNRTFRSGFSKRPKSTRFIRRSLAGVSYLRILQTNQFAIFRSV